MGKRSWIIFGIVTLIILGALVYFSRNEKTDVSGFNPDSIITANEQNGQIDDHVRGKKDSPVVLIEYADYQCAGCAGAFSRIDTLSQKYSDKIAFVFRNMPLTSGHPNALAAATAAEAAALQDKLWQMQKVIFDNQAEWVNADSSSRNQLFEKYAQQIGLDMDKYQQDLSSSQISKKISFDRGLASSKGVSATPSFYLNGELLDASTVSDEQAFEQIIKDAIEKAGL